jgi:hypothetical protein
MGILATNSFTASTSKKGLKVTPKKMSAKKKSSKKAH